MEGLLERRGAGVVGRWEQHFWRLDNDVLESFEPEDVKNQKVMTRIKAADISNVALDTGRREVLFTATNTAVRMRAQTEQEAKAWYLALQAVCDTGMSTDAEAPPPKKKTSDPMMKKKTVIVSEKGEELDPSDLLEKIGDLIAEKQMRVSDLFRHPQYNPSYFQKHDELLDPEEVSSVLCKAGLTVSPKCCKELILLMDDSGDCKLDMRELEAALRAHKRGGKEVWEAREEMAPVKTKKSMKDFKRKSMKTQSEKSGPIGPVMESIQNMLDEKQMRIMDIFRHPQFNPSYLQKGDESMDADEMQSVLAKAGVELSVKECHNMIHCIDEDGSGTVEIPELETAMRKFRRGVLEWVEKKDNSPKRQVNMERLNQLYRGQAEKTAKLEIMKKARERAEDDAIEMAKESARVGIRRLSQAQEVDTSQTSERLYNEFKELEHKHMQLAQKVEAEEKAKIDQTRIRPVRSNSDADLLKRNEGYSNIGERLHAKHVEKKAQMLKVKEEEEAKMLSEIDKISSEVIARGGVVGDRHLQLYEEAKDRTARKEKQRWMNLEAEQKWRAASAIGKDREALTDLKRIEELHLEHTVKSEKRKAVLEENTRREMDIIEKAAQEARKESQLRLANTNSKYKSMAPFENASETSSVAERKAKLQSPIAFGKRSPRLFDAGDDRPKWSIESVDHALHMVNIVCAARSNCHHEDAPRSALDELIEPLNQAMTEYADAKVDSETNGEGAVYLRNASSMRIFQDGKLMEDQDGWISATEPDPLCQLESNFDVLMKMAEKAQACLLAAVGPEAGDNNAEKLGRRWPKGAKWNHPRATKKAQFAFNPGVKSREAAEAKAFVRFGPSQRDDRYKHLTDLARCELVFVDASMLRAGLEQIIERFEVVDVRNYYHGSYQNLLGQKFVEVLVVLKIPEPFICEIRLEEFSFYMAREKAQKHIDRIAKAMSDMYSGNGALPSAIEYLSSWALHRPKELHAITVLRRNLSRKYGSTVIAWRKALGGGSQVAFSTFRQVCQENGQRTRVTEFFQELDPTRAGTISLFELDQDACVLLIKYFWRLCGVAGPDALQDPSRLLEKLAAKALFKPNRPGQLEVNEFRKVSKVLGFDQTDSDKVFQFLDSHGGEAHVPPATLLPCDIAWLKKIPQIISLESVMLRDAASFSEMDSLQQMGNQSARLHAMEGRRARMPASLVGRSSQRLSNGSGVSRPSFFARRSTSADARPSLTDRRRSTDSRFSNGSPAPTNRDILSPSAREMARSAPTSPAAAQNSGFSSGGEEDDVPKHVKALKAGDDIAVVAPFTSNSPQRAQLKRGQEGKLVRRESSGALMVEFPGIAGLQRISMSNATKITKAKSGSMSSDANSQRSTHFESNAVSRNGSEKDDKDGTGGIEQLWADSDSDLNECTSLQGDRREDSESVQEEDASGYASDTF